MLNHDNHHEFVLVILARVLDKNRIKCIRGEKDYSAIDTYTGKRENFSNLEPRANSVRWEGSETLGVV